MKRFVAVFAVAGLVAALMVGIQVGSQFNDDESRDIEWKCDGYVALTYDDGPTPITKTLVDSLNKYDMTATFFWKGGALNKRGEVAQYADKHGFQSGNHTWSHPHLTKSDDVDDQIKDTAQIMDKLDLKTDLFRPPYGETDKSIESEALSAGLSQIIWTVDTKDWEGRSAKQIARTIAKAEAGDIILMHDNNQVDLDAVALIAEVLSAKNLCTGKIIPSVEEKTAWDGLTFNASVVAP